MELSREIYLMNGVGWTDSVCEGLVILSCRFSELRDTDRLGCDIFLGIANYAN